MAGGKGRNFGINPAELTMSLNLLDTEKVENLD